MQEYPQTLELDRMAKLGQRHHAQSVGAFIDWLLTERGCTICEWSTIEPDSPLGNYVPVTRSINQWLHEWIGIDADECETERQAVLQYIQEKAQLKT